jgi:molybdopterin-binding protein
MATPQLSPGVLTREVDLTVGRAENVLDNIGAIAGPFEIGPIDEATDITTENQLINTFGKPISTDAQYEYWMAASSFLSYGGILKVVRTDDDQLNTANGSRDHISVDSSLKIKNYDDYVANYAGVGQTFGYAAKTPGTWAENLKVCVIDNFADQTLGIGTTTAVAVGQGVTVSLSNQIIAGSGDTSVFTGYLKGIVTGIGETTVDIKITNRVTSLGVSTAITYAEGDQARAIVNGNDVSFINSSAVGVATISLVGGNYAKDWYDQQTLGLTNSTVYWKALSPRPLTSKWAEDRSSKNDGIHVVVVDDLGTVTGIQGNILEKSLNLSKAKDAVSAENAPQKIYYKDYVSLYSDYVYAGDDPSDGSDGFVAVSDFSSGYTPISQASGGWNRDAQGITFNVIGNDTYSLTGGKDYSATGGFTATLGNLITSYNLFKNKDEIQVDYLIGGPGLASKEQSQAKANRLISIAGARKDCMATISPHRADVVDVTNTDTQTDNVIKFFSSLSSSSYAVFDSGYKYTYDRFNNKFRFIPTNGDVAGLMVRTSVNSFPWFSPAGQQRGILNNAIKLAYNPDKAQRDQLYPLRVNSIVNQPGTGIMLFGDKTGLGFASAFDRINVRRLFLTIEQALQKAAEAQLFELNDQVTRANFVNIVEPYLRDVEAKRGLYGFLVICDETNNTPDVIDNNEFRADIFLKPAKSINYVTLTFVATRTGVSFEEVAGRV